MTLRAVDPQPDAAALHPETHGSPQAEATWEFMAYGPFDNVEAMRRFLEGCAASTDPLFRTVVDRPGGRPLGMAAFQRVDRASRVLEVAHIWYVPGARRTTVNTEASFLMLRHAFDDLGYRRVEWKCDERNERSRAAALRLGFTYEGTFRKHMIVKGRSRDTAWYAMLDDDWPRVRAALERWLADPVSAGQLSALTARRDPPPPATAPRG